MTTVLDRCGLIILGNSGVGKSFLANILLGRNVFKHESTAEAVTTKTEFYEVTIEAVKYAIFNIPGLIEAQEAQIEANKREIDKAFKECPNAVIIYVFGNQNGRIRREDVIAFNALNDAYPFQNKSLVLVVNCIPPLNRRGENYEGKTIAFLHKLLDLKEWENICFLGDIRDEDEKSGKENVCEKLLSSILASMPNVHVKQHDINLEPKELQKLIEKYNEMVQMLKEQHVEFQKQIRIAQERHELERRELQKKFKALIKQQKEQIEAYEREKQQRQKQQAQETTGATQRQQAQETVGAGYSESMQRGAMTAAAFATATAPFAAASGPLAPLVLAASTVTGFAAGYLRKT